MGTYNINTEMTIRRMLDGLIGRHGSNKQIAAFIGFDMRIQPDTETYDQRDVALGVGLLKYGYTMLGMIHENFLTSTFDPKDDWQHISQHNSCWANSAMCWINRITRDVKEQREKHPLAIYGDEESIVWGNVDAELTLNTVNIIPVAKLVDLEYTDRHDNGIVKKLLSKWELTDLGLAV